VFQPVPAMGVRPPPLRMKETLEGRTVKPSGKVVCPMTCKTDLQRLPFMLYADEQGRIFDHPHLRLAGYSGGDPVPVEREDLVPMPEYSKLFFLPGCAPVGLDPDTGRYEVVETVRSGRRMRPCYAVAAFLEPGIVRTLLPASDCRSQDVILPNWAYTAVGFDHDRYWAAGFRVEDNPRWDPRNYDDRELVPAIDAFLASSGSSPLARHLVNCAVSNHCFAAKNLFLRRWEAPLPVSRTCNASCLGCLSLQPDDGCEASHQRIAFRPSVDDIVSLAVAHLEASERAIVSFGQGCEGEPLTEHALIAESVREIRKRTGRGTINLNTNGSMPDRVREIAACGLDSIRISMNSAQSDLYRAYYRPRGYDFEDVVESLCEAGKMGLYTMINLLVFPGVSDREKELTALKDLIRRTGVRFLHLKNLCIDPRLYLERMPEDDSPAVGMRRMARLLTEAFPQVSLGYFNQPVRD